MVCNIILSLFCNLFICFCIYSNMASRVSQSSSSGMSFFYDRDLVLHRQQVFLHFWYVQFLFIWLVSRDSFSDKISRARVYSGLLICSIFSIFLCFIVMFLLKMLNKQRLNLFNNFKWNLFFKSELKFHF
jgi:hypothetical protein